MNAGIQMIKTDVQFPDLSCTVRIFLVSSCIVIHNEKKTSRFAFLLGLSLLLAQH